VAHDRGIGFIGAFGRVVVLSPEDSVSKAGSGSPKDRNWPKDEFGRSEMFGQFWWVIPALLLLGLAVVAPLLYRNGARNQPEVIAYCAQDQVYAEPIFKDFEKYTGIKIRPLYDNEAVKTVGLANRLLAERNHPQADVFWGNEELRTRQLAAQEVFRPTNGWAAFGYRSRRLVINTNRISLGLAPHSLLDLTNQIWRGKVALAYPQFGTTATHFNALRQFWGDALWSAWCQALAANKPLVVDGNSVVVKMVARGEAWVGLTDSDDIADGQREGLPVAELPMNHETLLIPNTVAITRGAPHPQAAQSLFDYLQRRQVIERLITARALEGFSAKEVSATTMKVDWTRLLENLPDTTERLNQIFLR
jgi:iron(III) transport system substrate-binding protein